jgi:hypothetical protein
VVSASVCSFVVQISNQNSTQRVKAAVSRIPPRHRKRSRHASARRDPSGRAASHARREERAPAAARLRRKRARIAAAVAGSVLLISAAGAAVAHRHGPRAHSAAPYQASALGTRAAHGGLGTATPGRSEVAGTEAQRATAQREKQRQSPLPLAAASGYRNPLRAVSDLVVERVDQGVDFAGAGPVYALGDGVITSATADKAGWPGGGWITYRLTDGPDTGLTVYLAEDVTPAVQAGQTVTSSTVIANMFNGGDGIETGWATSAASTAEPQPPGAGSSNGESPFPTIVALNFEAVLEGLGVPAAPNAS